MRFPSICRLARLARSRRSSVALFVALVVPVLAAAGALGIEVSNWSVEKMRVQRAADAAAVSAMAAYKVSPNNQSAATAGARIAEVNGISGASTPTWDSSTNTLTDNNVTAQIVSGIQNASDTAVKITAKETVPLTLSKVFSSLSNVTVAATGYAELISTGSTSMQPCMLALGGGTDGITTDTTDVTFSGNVSIDANNCSIRSNDDIKFNGSVSVSVGGIYAGGAVTQTGSVSISGPIHQNAGQIPDPYVSFTALQNALTAAATATGTSVSITGSSSVTLNPGKYSGISVTGSTNVTLNPGLYVVNGNVSFAGSSNITGHGVTLILTGTLDTSGSTNADLQAATSANAVNGAIPGVLFASSSTSSSNFNGSSGLPFTGALYYPNGALVFSGSASDGSSGCAELIAKTITMSGSVSLSSNCSTYGLPTFSSTPSTQVAKLVQ